MKIIFLDIDGVCNYRGCGEIFKGFVGICPDNLKYLKQIIDASDAKIVLTSTWREDVKNHTVLGDYLLDKFNEFDLKVYDCADYSGDNRGYGIQKWLSSHNVESWVVLDDEVFPDYDEFHINSHLVKTSFYINGLSAETAKEAIKILND